MQETISYLEKLRVQVAQCEMIRDLASDLQKRELFARLADHFKLLADQLEKELELRDAGPQGQVTAIHKS